MTDYPTPIATVDVVLFAIREGRLCVMLTRRANEPYAGALALIGGFVHVDEDADTLNTARRVLADKAKLGRGYFVEQLYTFSGRARDPRGWSVCVAYYAVVPEASLTPDVIAEFVPVDQLPDLPFDHSRIIALALERLRGKATYSTLPAFLLPESFTIAELHDVYEQVLGTKLDRASFRRKIEDQGVVEPQEGGFRLHGAHRPAQLYRLTQTALQSFTRMI